MTVRKTAIWICAAAVLFSCFAFAAGATETVSLELQTPQTLPAVGERFEVTLLMTENPGVNTVQIILSYNRAALRCVGIEQCGLLRGMLSADNPEAKAGACIAAAALQPVTETGELAVFTFEVLLSGEADFSLRGTKFGDGETDFPLTAELTCAAEAAEGEPEREPEGEPAEPYTPDAEPVTGSPSVEESAAEEADDASADAPEAVLFSFPDAEGHWAEAEIKRAAAMGLVNGRDDGSFAPDAKMTRAELVTVLWRMAGKPEASQTIGFSDVADDVWYADAVHWATAEGIVKGNGDGGFAPNQNVTREQMAVILFRMSGGASGMELLFTDAYSEHFTDSEAVSDWARPGVYWAVYKGLMKGTTETTLSPKRTAGRAEVVTLLLRYTDKINRDMR